MSLALCPFSSLPDGGRVGGGGGREGKTERGAGRQTEKFTVIWDTAHVHQPIRARAHTHTHIHTHALTDARTHARTHTHTHTALSLSAYPRPSNVCVCVCVCVRVPRVFVRVHTLGGGVGGACVRVCAITMETLAYISRVITSHEPNTSLAPTPTSEYKKRKRPTPTIILYTLLAWCQKYATSLLYLHVA